MGTMVVKIKRAKKDDSILLPTRATEGSAGYDMYANIDKKVTIQPYSSRLIWSGIAVAIPEGYAGFIYARSGLSIKKGLRPSTCVSVIDSDYRGEIGLPIFNDSSEVRTIEPFERIAQIVFAPVLDANFELVDDFDATSRGTGGFGSTGMK